MLTLNLIKIMINNGFYSTIIIDPIAYHGYKETISTLREVIEEIDVELLLRPQDTNILLDHRISLQKRLDALESCKTKAMPSITN